MTNPENCAECMANGQIDSVNCEMCQKGICHQKGPRTRIVIENPRQYLDGTEKVKETLVSDNRGFSIHRSRI